MRKNKTSCVVTRDRRTFSRTYAVGHQQRRMIVSYDWYDVFQQIPFGAGVEHSFCFVYALETFVHALDSEIFLFYAI